MKSRIWLITLLSIVLSGVFACQSDKVENVNKSLSKKKSAPVVLKEKEEKKPVEKIEDYRKKFKKLNKKARLGQRETLDEQKENFKEFMAYLHKNKKIDDKSFQFVQKKLETAAVSRLKKQE